MHITLRPNEKIYVNGAVLKVDRKVSVELMNDAVFLLEAHVLLEHNATTLIRQLYYVVQTMLMEPTEVDSNRRIFHDQCVAVSAAYDNLPIIEGLVRVAGLVEKRRHFEALKVIRSLFPIEDTLLNRVPPPAVFAKAS